MHLSFTAVHPVVILLSLALLLLCLCLLMCMFIYGWVGGIFLPFRFNFSQNLPHLTKFLKIYVFVSEIMTKFKKNQVSCHIFWCWGKNYVFLLKIMVYESFSHIFALCFFIFLSYMPELVSTIHLVGSSLLFVPSLLFVLSQI